MLDKITQLLKEKLNKIDNNSIGILYDFPTSQAIPDFKLSYTMLDESFYSKREDEECFPLRMDIFNILERKFSIILGDFSGGKTHTAKQILKLLAYGFIEPEMRYGYYPILVNFASLAVEYKNGNNLLKAVAIASDYSLATLIAIAQNYDTVFIFDCLDDVTSSVQSKLVKEILRDPYIAYNRCIFTASNCGEYCEYGKKHRIGRNLMAKFRIEELRNKDIKNILNSFSPNNLDGLFNTIIEMEKAIPEYKSLSRNISSLLGIISYYEKNRSLPQNRLELTEYFVDRLLLNRLSINENELSIVKEHLGYKATKKIYSVLDECLTTNNQVPCEGLGDWNDNGNIINIESLANEELKNALSTSTIQAYLSAYYIFKRINAKDYSIIEKIAGASYTLTQLVLEYLLLILDREKEAEESFICVLALLQDTFKPQYDSIVQSVLFFKNNKRLAVESILKTMLTRGVACIANPPETMLDAFVCQENKVKVDDYMSYSANPYEELFYYVVKYDLYDYLPKKLIKNRIAKKLLSELQALNSEQDTEIIEILDDYTDGFMAYIASEFRAGIPMPHKVRSSFKGHLSSTTKAIDFYNNYLSGKHINVSLYGDNARGEFCTDNPYLTSIYIDNPTLHLCNFFKGNCNLKRIKVSDNNEYYYSQNNCIILKDSKKLVMGCKASVIPNDVTIIGEDAFFNQQQLTEIDIPDSVNSIYENAFMYCTALNHLRLSKDLRTIKENAFSFCTALEELHIPEKIKNTNHAFWALESLRCISVDDKNQNFRIEKGCLIANNTNTVVATTVNAQIPDGVFAISDYAFAYNENLTEVIIPETITEIHNNTFLKCTGLKRLTIPKTVTTLGEKCFFGCSSLKHATVYASLKKKNTALFAKCRVLDEINIEGSMSTAAVRMFYGCMNLKQIALPEDTSVIDREFVKDCRSLRKIDLPKNLLSINSSAFENTGLVELTVPYTIGVINNGTFKDCSYLKQINFTGQLFHIEKGAFQGCRALTSVTYENSRLFENIEGCVVSKSTPSIYLGFPSTSIPSGIEKIESCAYESRMGLQMINLGSNVKCIGNDAFANCFELRKADMPNVEELNNGCFDGCVSLAQIELGGSLRTIKYDVFRNCKSLKTITIPYKVRNIGPSCFIGCDSLEEIRFFADVKTLPAEIFSGLKSLKEVLFTEPIPKWRNGIFKACTALEKFTIPSSVIEIGNGCFEGCTSLKKATLSANLKTLPPNTFKDCTSLKTLVIPVSIVGICKAFENCTALNELTYLGTKRQWESIMLDGSCSEIFGDLPTSIVKCLDGITILK